MTSSTGDRLTGSDQPDAEPSGAGGASLESAPGTDKYNDPRAKITRRGVLIGLGVAVFAVVGAIGSIYARKTPLVKSTEFWGGDAITAFQLGERMELFPRGPETFQRVELTTTPGLGHLRRALLDERNYQWDTVREQSVQETFPVDPSEKPRCIQLRFTDPTAHRFEAVELDIDLQTGWLGPSDGSKRVQLTSWVQPKLQNWFATVINVQQRRYDLRQDDSITD